MRTFFDIPTITAIFLAVLLTAPSKAAQPWPLDGNIDLSSGFGDFRDGHFHGGIDLRTGGKVGARVSSPVDGSVWRVKMSYRGYGKGLYIRGDDGHIYVFGHLAGFSGKIDEAVKATQMAARRYYLDWYPPRDSIRISKGEFIAYSGQTGVGSPHLHFEKRSEDNVPLNPLTHGFKLKDKVRPSFTRLGFEMLDDSSLFSNARRKTVMPVKNTGTSGKYAPDTVLYFNRPFGILIDGFDMMRAGGMKQAIYRLRLYIDGKLLYESEYDELDFETTDAVRLEYDCVEAADGRKRVRRLWQRTGNRFGGIRGKGSIPGAFGLSGDETVGPHEARVVAQDCYGNEAELKFDFIWGPPGNVYALDSTVTREADTVEFYLTPQVDLQTLGIDSVIALRNVGDRWGTPPSLSLTTMDDGRLMVRAAGSGWESAVLQLFLKLGHNGHVRDALFCGLLDKQPDRCEVKAEVVEDGLLIKLECWNRRASESRIELYSGDSLLGTEYPVYFDMNNHFCFIPPKPEYARIDRIGAAMSRDTARPVRSFADSLHIYLVGDSKREDIRFDEFFAVSIGEDNLYEPRYIQIKKGDTWRRPTLRLNSSFYQILPEAFATRSDFDITLRVTNLEVNEFPSGLCWLDTEEDEWVWLDNEVSADTLRATSQGGGTFAAIMDYDPPDIVHLNIHDGKTYKDPRQRISFLIRDTLSGIGDDEDIVIEVDGQWLIPEYDPENDQCFAQPLEPLEPGKHHLGIRVTDRAGNLGEQYLNFSVRRPKGKR